MIDREDMGPRAEEELVEILKTYIDVGIVLLLVKLVFLRY